MNPFRLATAQFPVYAPSDWPAVEAMLSQWVEEAAQAGAGLLVFPEYASMSLAALFPPEVQRDLQAQIAHMQELRETYLGLHKNLARRYGVHILAGSFPWRQDDGRFHNRAWLCGPDGSSAFQDKRIMTRFEREQWSIDGGAEVPLKVFDTALGMIGVDVCYDIEFPALAAAQARAGASLILTPSCTDTPAGHHRVHIGARARALENQCLVAVSPLVGEAPWSPAVDVNVGAAALYGPADRGFPDDGVLAQGRYCRPGWIYADVTPARVVQVRNDGQVFNFRHGGEKAAQDVSRVAIESLR